MRTQMLFTKSAMLSFAAFLSVASFACAGEIAENDEPYDLEPSEHVHSSALTQEVWTHCSNQDRRCRVSGTQQVRFGANGRFTTRSVTSSIWCSNSSFGVRYGTGNHCEVLSRVEVDAGSDGGHTGHTDAGMAMGDAGMMMGPYIDNSKIPAPGPSMSGMMLGTTSEQPVPSDIGAFRTSCQFSHMNYDDPIVFPNQPGKAHLHTYFGNTAANASSTAESIRTSGNSTCRGGIANRSAYWVPAVIDQNGTPLKPHSAQVYYKTGYEGIAPSQVNVFPQGLRMIAGDAKAAGATNERGYWGCETYIGHPKNVPSCAAGERVIMIVQFPQCWNGRDLDSADHKSHMAYPRNGACPSTHPVAIPEISFNIYYNVPAGSVSSKWRLSSDMYDKALPGGYSVHGDWFEGWDRGVAESFVKNCNRASKDCHSHLVGDGRTINSTIEPNDQATKAHSPRGCAFSRSHSARASMRPRRQGLAR
jgi:hypothetical protein